MDNLLRSTDIGTVFADPDGLIRRLTPAAFRLLGLRPADLGRPSARPPGGWSPGVDLAGMVRAVLDSGRPLEREVRSADGRDFLLRVLPCQNERGRVEGAVATFVDICRVKGAESALARTEVRLDEQGRLLDALIAAMGDGVILLNPEGRVVLFNPAAERILGRGPDLGTPENWPAAYGFKLPDQAHSGALGGPAGARALRGEAADEEEFFVERRTCPAGSGWRPAPGRCATPGAASSADWPCCATAPGARPPSSRPSAPGARPRPPAGPRASSWRP
jgi:PAS domain-containing protein